MSMRIIDLQRRLREIGRLRIGEQVESRNGKKRPAKIDVFRFTSRDRQVIEAAAAQWGGTCEEWTDAPGDGTQWQVRSTAQQIPVVVPPGDMSFSQSYEQWTAGGCKVRCDSRWDHVGDQPCHCDPDKRACAIHTRLSVMLPDLPGVGVWRLETHGYYAAVELGGVVDLCAAQSAQGRMLPARLRLEHREVKRTVDGKVQTRKFVVPVLDLDVHPMALSAPPSQSAQLADPVTGELSAPAPAALPSGNLTPVPEPDGRLAPSVAHQLAEVNEDRPAPARANAAAVLPATGVEPRPAAEAEIEHRGIGKADVAQAADRAFADWRESAPKGKMTRTVDRLRRAVTWRATGCRTASLKECTGEELAKVHARLGSIADGEVVVVDAAPLDDAGGVTFRANGNDVTVLWSEFETGEGS